MWTRPWLMRRARISAPRELSKLCWTASSKRVTPARSIAGFRLARLQAKHSIDSFNFNHHKTRLQCKSRILRLLDLGFLEEGTAGVLHRNPRRGETFLTKNNPFRACPSHPR